MKIKWNLPAFEEIRRLPAVRRDLEQRAEDIADACGDGYVAESGEGKTRSRAAVITATPRAMRDNAKNNTIIKNVEAGRD